MKVWRRAAHPAFFHPDQRTKEIKKVFYVRSRNIIENKGSDRAIRLCP
jgi:hypothetical protein